MSRYSRQIVLSEVGQIGQEKLSKASVLVVGAGGLGCPLLQYLTAAGIGRIGIIDFDLVEESNLQRQILFGTSSLGKNKAIAAKIRLEDLNPLIEITAYPEKLTSKNALTLFGDYDIIVDGTDNFTSRYLINDASIIANKPVVYGAIYKFEGQVSVFNYQYGPSYRCLFPSPPKTGSAANCSEVGVLGILPGIIGTMQANEVLKIILGLENVLSGILLCFNALTSELTKLKITKSSSEIAKVLERGILREDHEIEIVCQSRVLEISVEEAWLLENVQFIDVREVHEKPMIKVAYCTQIPLDTLEQNLFRISNEKHKIFFCQFGARSRSAVEILQTHGYDNCYSLLGGVRALVEQLKMEKQ